MTSQWAGLGRMEQVGWWSDSLELGLGYCHLHNATCPVASARLPGPWQTGIVLVTACFLASEMRGPLFDFRQFAGVDFWLASGQNQHPQLVKKKTEKKKGSSFKTEFKRQP